jgi:hypothetical protein
MEMKTELIDIFAIHKAYPGQDTLSIEIDLDQAKQMGLLLTLLKEDLIKSAGLILKNGSIYISKNTKKQDKCLNFSLESNEVNLELTDNTLGYLLFFLLKYVRDSIGEAHHIDIDFKYLMDKEFTLTVKLKDYVERSGKHFR